MAGVPRGRGALIGFAALLAVAFAGFCALGAWQLQRLQWKRALIERVEQRVHAPPVAAPPRAAWDRIDAEGHEYLRVRLSGTWLGGPDTRVQAVTALGAGWWLLSPLRTRDGDIVLVNRGFAPQDADAAAPDAGAAATVIGLLRLSEPGGGFLRRNVPAAGRWYSRDVHAIAAARRLGEVAPYFVDAAGQPSPAWPRSGLTVVQFRNAHLSYALTWFSMAALTLVAGALLYRHERRVRQHGA